MQYCSLQHRTLLLSPVTSTFGYCYCFGSISSFFLEVFLHWSPVAYWTPTDLGSSSLSILSFCLFILFMGFSRQEYWSGLPFPSPVDHILSDLSTMTRPSWVAPWAWLSFIELDKAVVHVWFSVIMVSVCLPSDALSPTSTVLLGFLLPWAWGIASQLLQQSAATAPYLGWGISPHRHPSWPWMWSSSSQPSCACTAAAPWTWGSSSQPPLLTLNVEYLLSALLHLCRHDSMVSLVVINSKSISWIDIN